MDTTRIRISLPRISATAALLLAVLSTSGSLVSCTPAGETSPATGAATAADGTDPGEVLARVGGEPVTRAQVEEAAAEPLAQVESQLRQAQVEARQQRHQILEGQTRQLVRERLLTAEAEKRGVTQDELLQAEVQSRVAAVTPAEVDAFYEQNRARIPSPKEQVAPQIAQYLRQQRESAAYEELVSGLEKASQVAYEIGPYRMDIDIAGEPAKGPEDAPVTIVEFSDFQCPFCSRVLPTLKQVEQNYGDRVRVVFKQFPLRNLHPDAQKAAEASLCAHDQGKFWQMHDAMFADQGGLAVPGLEAKAAELGLDAAKFSECLSSGRYADAVQKDLDQGGEAGVAGTPALFVNGRFLSGAVPYEQIAQVIDDELGRQGEGS
jgi:protein-disulfide isomerase